MDRTEQSLLEIATKLLKLRAELQALRELVKGAENSAACRCAPSNAAIGKVGVQEFSIADARLSRDRRTLTNGCVRRAWLRQSDTGLYSTIPRPVDPILRTQIGTLRGRSGLNRVDPRLLSVTESL
jgi:hypothetical protein